MTGNDTPLPLFARASVSGGEHVREYGPSPSHLLGPAQYLETEDFPRLCLPNIAFPYYCPRQCLIIMLPLARLYLGCFLAVPACQSGRLQIYEEHDELIGEVPRHESPPESDCVQDPIL